MSVDVIQFDLREPDDLSGLAEAVARHGAARIRRLALLLRVAGEYTDGSREKARGAVERFLGEHGLSDRAEFITVIGAEGASTPCGYALLDLGGERAERGELRLALGLARVAPPPEESFGSVAYAHDVRRAAAAAIADGGLSPNEVETIIVNVPQPTSGDIAARGRRARAAAALGAGLALGEITPGALTEASIVDDPALYAERVQTFTGPAIRNIEVIVIGNAPGAGGDLVARNVVTQDLLDVRSIKAALRGAGLTIDADGELDTDRLVATIAKLGVHPSGRVAGAPTTIFTSTTPPEKHVRAALSGVLGAVLHTTRIFSTFDPVQQAPLGGGTLCFILRAAPR